MCLASSYIVKLLLGLSNKSFINISYRFRLDMSLEKYLEINTCYAIGTPCVERRGRSGIRSQEITASEENQN